MRDYVDAVNKSSGGKVFNWGYTKNYSYWKERTGVTEHPVSAEVDWIGYGPCSETDHSNYKTDCTGLFRWSVNAGVNGPFSLKVLTMLPVCYRQLPSRPFFLELNHLSATMTMIKWGHPSLSEETVIFNAKCKFEAEIDFDGYFAYLLLTGEASFQWIAVNVTALAKESKGLRIKRGKLTYLLMGNYEETIWCDRKDNKRR